MIRTNFNSTGHDIDAVVVVAASVCAVAVDCAGEGEDGTVASGGQGD